VHNIIFHTNKYVLITLLFIEQQIKSFLILWKDIWRKAGSFSSIAVNFIYLQLNDTC